MIEDGLAKASFPDLKVLAAETTTPDDDRIVDALIKLRTEELQMEVNWRNVEALPARRRAGADTLEQVRRRFKEAGLDSPYVIILRGAFEAALEAYGKGPAPDGEALWRAITRDDPPGAAQDDDLFRRTAPRPQHRRWRCRRRRDPRRSAWRAGGMRRRALGRWRLGRRRRRWRRLRDRRRLRRRRLQDRRPDRRRGGFKTGGRF